jgi:hypothetical protein
VFTPEEKVAIRIHAGYPDFGNQYELESVFFGDGYELLEKNRLLEFALNNLSTAAENQVRDVLLPDLETLRADVFNVRDNADTAEAAIWKRNPQEYSERKKMYSDRCVELCNFLNIPHAPNSQTATRRIRV